MSCESRQFVIDATALITFGKNGQLQLLEELLAGRGLVTDEVFVECRSLRVALEAAFGSGRLIRTTLSAPAELAKFAELRAVMDAGEASTLAAAVSAGAALVTDDLAAIGIGRATLGAADVLGCGELLCLAVEHGLLSPEQAATHYATFQSGGAYLPDVSEGHFDLCVAGTG